MPFVDFDEPKVGGFIDFDAPEKPPAAPGIVGRVKDIGISALKGAIGVPEFAVGLADLVSGGRVGKAAEELGFRPKEAKEFLSTGYSDAQKKSFDEVQKAEGLWDTTKAAVSNPSVIAQTITESVPAMLGGGLVARGLIGGTRLGATELGKLSAIGLGEGVVTAGSSAEQIRQQTADGLLTGEQAVVAGATGLATGALGMLGAKIAKSLGIADVDSLIAGAAKGSVSNKGLTRRVLEGAFAEGILEELPQSVQEQVAQNYALGKPLDEGVNQAAVLGALSGAAMGGGLNIVQQKRAEPPTLTDIATAPTADAAIQAFVGSVSQGDAAVSGIIDNITQGDTVRQQQAAQAFGAEKGLLASLPSIASLPARGTAQADAADLNDLVATEQADLQGKRQGIIQRAADENDAYDLNDLVSRETQDLDVLRGNAQRDYQKQQETDQLQAESREQLGRLPDQQVAAANAATVEAPTAMQLAMQRAMAVRPSEAPAEPTPPAGPPSAPPAGPSGPTTNPDLQPGDIARKDGSPFQSENGARLKQREAGGTDNSDIAPVPGGFVVRPKSQTQENVNGPQAEKPQQVPARQQTPEPISAPAQPAAGSIVPAATETRVNPLAAAKQELAAAPQGEITSTFTGKFGKGMGKDAAKLEAGRLNRASDGLTYTAEEHGQALENPYAVVGRKISEQTAGKPLGLESIAKDATETVAPSQAASGPEYLGRNNIPLSEGGKPFKTNRDAKKAKRNQPMLRVKTVPGGFALAPATEAQIAAQEAAAKRLGTARIGNKGLPAAAHQFIAGEGGLNPSIRSDLGVEGNPRIGNRTLYARAGAGLTLEQATEALKQDGYLGENASHTDALNLIRRSMTVPQYTPEGAEVIAQVEANARFEDFHGAELEAAQSEDFDPFESIEELGFSMDDAESAGYDEALDPIKLEVNALLQQAEALGIDTDTIKEQAHEDTRNGSEQDFYEVARDSLQAAIEGSNGNRSEDAGQPGDAPSEGLTAPTRENVLAQQDRAEQAEKSAKAQQKAKDEIARREQERKDIAARSVGAADSFELGGDANQNLSGQEGLFANEPQAAYSARYETDLFGDPLPTPPGANRPARSAEAGVRGNVQPESGLRDTEAPAGEYHVNTIVGTETKRELGASLIRTPVHAAQATQYLYKSAVERFDGIVTDKNGKVLAVVGGFKGAVSQASVYPATIMAEAIRIPGAARIWFSHNHPSGNAALSRADESLNLNLADVFRGSGIESMGLLAIGGDTFSHIDATGNQSGGTIPLSTAAKTVPVIERQMAENKAMLAIESPKTAAAAAKGFYGKSKQPGIMLMDSKLLVAAWVPISDVMMGPLRGTGGAAAIYRAVSQSNATSAIIVHGGELDYGNIGYSKVTPSENIAAALKKIDVRPMDSINVVSGVSLAERGLEIERGPVFSRTQPFYSALAKEVSNINANAQSAMGWMANLRGLVSSGKVKADELEWSGVTDFLKLQNGKVMKADVVSFLDANGVKVTETVLSDTDFELDKNGEKQEDVFGDYLLTGKPTKYSQYQLPGGTSYREVLLTLPRKQLSLDEYAVRKYGKPYAELPAAAQLNLEHTMDKQAKELGGEYKSSHWDQPNVLAHIRINDRVDADGARVLFVEEIQSDWGQAGKKEGFITQNEQLTATKTAQGYWEVRGNGGRFVSNVTEPMTAEAAIAEARNRQQNRPQSTRSGVPTAPFITNTDKWLALALKRVIKMAVDGGYAKVAFVNGEQSADRYDLSKQISEVRAQKMTSGLWHIEADDKNGGAVIGKETDEAGLPDVVGKELAQRIIERRGGTFSGLDLKVGGEGMKAFYDKIIPSATKDVLRKLGGGQMEMVSVLVSQGSGQRTPAGLVQWVINVDGREWNGYSSESVAREELAELLGNGKNAELVNTSNPASLKQPGFTLTDTLKERAADGVPLFSQGKPSAAQTQAIGKIESLVAGIKANWNNAPPIVVAFDLRDPRIPERVRQEDLKQRSGGAVGTPEGFYYQGSVYLMSAKLKTPNDVARVLAHEALGHYGLRGLFGDALKPILREISVLRKADVRAKANAYGLSDANPADLLTAAEEVLAELAQTNPEISFVRRAIAAIRSWLRQNVPGFKSIGLTDDEIIRSYLMPARGWVERGAQAQTESVPVFARGTNDAMTNKDVVGKSQANPADDSTKGANKAVDSNGKPVTVYHGTPRTFDKFEAKHISSGMYGEGFYFTNLEKDAELYAEGGRVIPATLTINNPASRAVAEEAAERIGEGDYAGIREELERMGYDGVIAHGSNGGEVIYVAFKPEQINQGGRSADDSSPGVLRSYSDVRDAVSKVAEKMGFTVFSADDSKVSDSRYLYLDHPSKPGRIGGNIKLRFGGHVSPESSAVYGENDVSVVGSPGQRMVDEAVFDLANLTNQAIPLEVVARGRVRQEEQRQAKQSSEVKAHEEAITKGPSEIERLEAEAATWASKAEAMPDNAKKRNALYKVKEALDTADVWRARIADAKRNATENNAAGLYPGANSRPKNSPEQGSGAEYGGAGTSIPNEPTAPAMSRSADDSSPGVKPKHSPEQMAKWAAEKEARYQSALQAGIRDREYEKASLERQQNRMAKADMWSHFTASEKADINFYDSTTDRNDEGAKQTVNAIERVLKSVGVKIDHISESDSGKSKSLYAKLGSEIVRVSEHELPMTPQRENDRARGLTGKWDREVIVSDWLNTTMGEYLDEIGVPAAQRLGYAANAGAEAPNGAKSSGDEISIPNEPTAPDSGGAPAFSRSLITGQPLPQVWQAPDATRMDNVIYAMQDKHVDTKRVVAAVREKIGTLADELDPYLQEELYHGRSASATKKFLENGLRPLLTEMQARSIDLSDFEEYLHNRHAERRNVQVAKVNPKMQDGGSGINTADARAYLAGLTVGKRTAYQALAKRVDQINRDTRSLLVSSGLEKQATIDAWQAAYGDEYVPLMREEMDAGTSGIGQGFSVRGGSSKRALGSDKPVANILANIALQWEKAITRTEKQKIGHALYGMVLAAPNDNFWFAVDPQLAQSEAQITATALQLIDLGLNPADAQSIAKEPTERYIDPRTGQVAERINPALRSADNVLAVRIDGEDKYVFFNAQDARAMRMAKALKNLDADQLGAVMGSVAKVTRYFAAINTQYNPIFGVVNLTRDVQTAVLNLQSTALKGKQADVMTHVVSALRGIYIDLRDHRAGKQPSSTWAKLFEEFQREGGATGYRDMYANPQERADALVDELKAIKDGKALKLGKGIMGWLSDYNESMENAVRVATYKVGKESGLSNQQAASLAKNLTVNFNRGGQVKLQVGALYAFFNASVQGTARMGQTMFKDGKLSGLGKKILTGGLLLGSMQALLLAAAGFDDEEPPDFVRERSLVIPTGSGRYISIPMPLGFHVLPNLGRIPTEWAMGGFKNTPKRLAQMAGLFADAFNPIGSAGLSLQTLTPTVIDPLAALAENRDFTGKPIARKDFNSLKPTAGHTRSKDTATPWAKAISYALNMATGGTDYTPGEVSPTPDQIDYLIGQATGGVGREAGKFAQSVGGASTGEEVPLYKIPLIGRFVGTTEGQAAEASRFYSNLKEIGLHDTELDGLRKDRRMAEAAQYLREHPQAMLVKMADKTQREVSKLNKTKRELVKAGASPERVKLIEQQITARMAQFNQRVKIIETRETATP